MRGNNAAATMPANIAQTTLRVIDTATIATPTAVMLLIAEDASEEATRAAITETESPSMKRCTLTVGLMRDMKTAPAMRVANTATDITMIARPKDTLLIADQHRNDSADDGGQDNVPTGGQHRQRNNRNDGSRDHGPSSAK